MSGTAPIGFAALPRVSQLRLAAVAVLQAAGTCAGSNVLDTPLDPLDPDAMFPVITAAATVERTIRSRAGGIPVFDVTFTLHVAAGVIRAVANDARLQCDVLAQQMLDGLFCDPVLIKTYMGQIDTVTEKKSYSKAADRYIATAEYAIASVPIRAAESYVPNYTSPLDPNGVPLALLRTVIAPLTTITETLAVGAYTGGAPAAGDIVISGSQTFAV